MLPLMQQLTLDARVIMPGHGLLCGEDTITTQLKYIQRSWTRTADHIAPDHCLEEILADSNYPIHPGLGAKQLHTRNIKVMYRQFICPTKFPSIPQYWK
jgi:hypothetical protein